jgi:hypothetical protein
VRSRTTVLLLVAALTMVVGLAPASASDDDRCEDLLNALDALENRSRANPHAVATVRTNAEVAGCFDPPAANGFEALCVAAGGTYLSGMFVNHSIYECYLSAVDTGLVHDLMTECAALAPGAFAWQEGLLRVNCFVPGS